MAAPSSPVFERWMCVKLATFRYWRGSASSLALLLLVEPF